MMIWLLKQLWLLPRHLFWLGIWIFGLIVLTCYLLRWGAGDRLLPVRLTNYFMPWLLTGLLPTLLLTGLARRKGLFIILSIPIIGIALTFGPQFISVSDKAQANNRRFTVMSYNVLHTNQEYANITQIIQQAQPDIVLLQEFMPTMLPHIEAHLEKIFHGTGYIAYEPAIAQAIISRYPIVSEGGFYQLGRAQKAIVYTPYGPVRVWNVHPRTAVGQEQWSLQQAHLRALGDAVARVKEPLIVAGDFNTTAETDNYRLVGQHLYNAHQEAGYGFGFTFPAEGAKLRNVALDYQWQWLSKPWVAKLFHIFNLQAYRQPLFINYPYLKLTRGPVVRIDHIFYNNHFTIHQATTLADSGGSDHLPIVAVLELKLSE